MKYVAELRAADGVLVVHEGDTPLDAAQSVWAAVQERGGPAVYFEVPRVIQA